MPIQISAFQLPSGAQGVRADCMGTVSKEDAAAWLQQVDPGGAYYGLPILAVTQQLDRVAPEARSMFGRRDHPENEIESWKAVVVSNPVIRVTTNFVIRISRTRKMRLFATEGEAMRWLDERLQEGAAR